MSTALLLSEFMNLLGSPKIIIFIIIFQKRSSVYIGEGNGNPLQYSCLENPMDRGAWEATVHGVARVGHDSATKLPPPPSVYIVCMSVCLCISTKK